MAHRHLEHEPIDPIAVTAKRRSLGRPHGTPGLQHDPCRPRTSVQGQTRENALSCNDRALALVKNPQHPNPPRIDPVRAATDQPRPESPRLTAGSLKRLRKKS